ncbi:hypothetical protein Tco_0399325, partial [Tanacetum coccineum]
GVSKGSDAEVNVAKVCRKVSVDDRLNVHVYCKDNERAGGVKPYSATVKPHANKDADACRGAGKYSNADVSSKDGFPNVHNTTGNANSFDACKNGQPTFVAAGVETSGEG